MASIVSPNIICTRLPGRPSNMLDATLNYAQHVMLRRYALIARTAEGMSDDTSQSWKEKKQDAFRRNNHGADRRGCPDLPVRGGTEVA